MNDMNLHKIIRDIFCIGIILFIQGCKKEIDIQYKYIDPITVIEAQLTQNGSRVKITRTTPMDEPMDTVPLTSATVTISDITNGSVETLVTDPEGNFIGSVSGIPGHMYELNVNMAEVVHRSRCEMLSPVYIQKLEFNWIKMPYDYVAVLQVTFLDNPEVSGECYWIRLYRNGKAYMWNIVPDLYASDGIINNVFMTTRKDLDEEEEDTILRDGDVISASVTPVSREMYDYLEAVSSDSNGPAMFTGDFCLGYFLASCISEASIIFHPDSIPVY